MWNGYHSVELFLKAAVLRRLPEIKLHHDIEDLKSEYDRLYPGPGYAFEMPFKAEILGFDEEEVAERKKDLKKRMPPDQLNRYPMDRFKKTLGGNNGI